MSASTSRGGKSASRKPAIAKKTIGQKPDEVVLSEKELSQIAGGTPTVKSDTFT